MAEYTKNDVQLVQPNQPVLLDTTIGCNKGYVIHREGSGILTLRGIVNGINSCFARYQATFVGNIGIPSDGTAPSPIGIAVAIDGEPVLTSKALVTPAVLCLLLLLRLKKTTLMLQVQLSLRYLEAAALILVSKTLQQ